MVLACFYMIGAGLSMWPWILWAFASGQWLYPAIYAVVSIMFIYGGATHLVMAGLRIAVTGLIKRNRYNEVVRLALRASAILRNTPILIGTNLAEFQAYLGSSLAACGEYNHAYVVLEKGVQQAKEFGDPDHPDLLLSMLQVRLARTCIHLGQVDEAESLLNEVLASEKDPTERAIALTVSAALQQTKNRPEKMLENLRESQRLLPSSSGELRVVQELLSAIAFAMKDDVETSVEHAKQAITICENAQSLFGDPGQLCWLCQKYMEHDKLKEAGQLVTLAYDQGKLNSHTPESDATLVQYEKFLRATSREDEIQDMRAWLK